MKKYILPIFTVLFMTLSASECKKTLNLFSIEDDKKLGEQVDAEILANTAEYKILDPVQYKYAYDYTQTIFNNILNSGKVKYKDNFNWTLRLIHNDTVLNAFATPGGYVYLYTGLIKYLDAEHELAGVLGHEIAHADNRHTTERLTKIYGLQVLLAIAIGENQNLLTDIAATLAVLSFSRSAESESDASSVEYLCPTKYTADGAAAFFEKLTKSGQAASVPTFLSTHPNPGNRITKIKEKKTAMECKGSGTYQSNYRKLKASLPK